MINVLPQAYFIEVLQLTMACTALVLVCWMIYDTWFELEVQREAKKNDPTLPEDWWWWAVGSYKQELWRLFETSVLTGVGFWSVFTSTPDGWTYYYWFDYKHSVSFWDPYQNLNVWRIVAILITGAKFGASITARYYRQLANAAIKERMA
jgi:hypothetical protein